MLLYFLALSSAAYLSTTTDERHMLRAQSPGPTIQTHINSRGEDILGGNLQVKNDVAILSDEKIEVFGIGAAFLIDTRDEILQDKLFIDPDLDVAAGRGVCEQKYSPKQQVSIESIERSAGGRIKSYKIKQSCVNENRKLQNNNASFYISQKTIDAISKKGEKLRQKLRVEMYDYSILARADIYLDLSIFNIIRFGYSRGAEKFCNLKSAKYVRVTIQQLTYGVSDQLMEYKINATCEDNSGKDLFSAPFSVSVDQMDQIIARAIPTPIADIDNISSHSPQLSADNNSSNAFLPTNLKPRYSTRDGAKFIFGIDGIATLSRLNMVTLNYRYTVEGNEIHLFRNGEKTVLTIHPDGSFGGPINPFVSAQP